MIPEQNFINSLPQIRKWNKTYLEIMKVSHRENTMANLLHYFFTPTESHGLGDIFIKGLLQTKCFELQNKKECSLPESIIPYKDKSILWAEVKREDLTGDKKRIDLLIETEKFVIVIEFKINHILNNPLNQYKKHVEENYPNEKPKYFLVLTPTWQAPLGEINDAFRQVIFSHFILNVRKLIAKSSLQDEIQKYYLEDFLSTIENRRITMDLMNAYRNLVNPENTLKVENISMEKEMKETPEAKLEDLYYTLQKVKSELDNKMKGAKPNDYHFIGSYADRLDCTVTKHLSNGYSIKLRLKLSGWQLESWRGKQMLPQTEKINYDSEAEEISAALRKYEEKLINE